MVWKCVFCGRKKSCTEISMHKFPLNQSIRTAWIEFVRQILRDSLWQPKVSAAICSLNFEAEDIVTTFGRKGVKLGAIPKFRRCDGVTVTDLCQTMNAEAIEFEITDVGIHSTLATAANQPSPAKVKLPPNKFESTPVRQVKCNARIAHRLTPRSRDHRYTIQKSPKTLLMTVKVLERKLKGLQAQLKAAKLQLRRNNAKQLHERAKLLVEKAKARKYMATIKKYAGLPVDLLVKRGRSYSEQQRRFAMTIHFYGHKAYKYLQRHLKLPSMASIRRWMSHIDSRPGILQDAITLLAEKRKSSEGHQYELCTIAIDGMAIRSECVIDPQDRNRVIGYEDVGFGVDNSSSKKLAKEAVVFLAVGLKGHWKVAVAYVLVCGLTGVKQACLLKHVMMKMHDIGVRVVAVVTDGLTSNQLMYKQFGCMFEPENMKTTFKHPADGKQVYAFFDACHLIKLMRNALAQYGLICSPFFGKAYWLDIVHMNDVQKKEGLRAANKLTDAHIHFENQKMKVSLAAQVFSRSVSLSLAYMRQLKHSDFTNCEGSELFLSFIDELFDLLNSKSPAQKGTKGPINSFNMKEKLEFLENAENILLSLEIGNGISLCETPRRLCSVGFAANCMSLRLLTIEMINEQYLTYLLTYKLSQDHLELFFAALRSRGGKNNNPNALQLRHILKAILSHCDIVLGLGTNVVGQDDTCLLQADKKVIPFALNANTLSTAEGCSQLSISDAYNACLTPFVDGVVEYIAGFVVKKMLQTERCSECRESLVSRNGLQAQEYPPMSVSLLLIKDLGGLNKPSQSVLHVIKTIETALRANFDVHKINSSQGLKTHVIEGYVLHLINNTSCFNELDYHFRQTLHVQDSNVSCHYTELIRKLCRIYLNIRTRHMCHLTNELTDRKLLGLRKKLTKTILFCNQ